MRSVSVPFELIERDARLQRRRRVDQIRDGFRLNEIALAVEKRTQRELARLGEPRAGRHRAPEHRVQDHGTAVRR